MSELSGPRAEHPGFAREGWQRIALLLLVASAALASHARSGESLYLDLVVNGVSRGALLPVTRVGDAFWVRRADALLAGLPVPDEADPFRLDELEDIDLRYLPERQRLFVDLPPSWLGHTHLEPDPAPLHPASSDPGLLINYDLLAKYGDAIPAYAALWHEARLFGGKGRLASTAMTRLQEWEGDREVESTRLETTWRRAFRPELLEVEVGDTIVPGLSGGAAARVGGVRITRRLSMQPDLNLQPWHRFQGTLDRPSLVEITAGDTELFSGRLEPGSYSIDSPLSLSGISDARIVTTDHTGQRTERALLVYGAPGLLRPGLIEFSATAGWPRQRFGSASNDYSNRTVFAMNGRRGVTDTLTVEAYHAISPDRANAGLGAVARLGVAGMLVADVEGSRDDSAGNGKTGGLRYLFSARRFGLALSHRHREDDFRSIGDSDDEAVRVLDSTQLAGSLHLGQAGSVNIGLQHLRTSDRSSQRSISFGMSRLLFDRVSAGLGVFRDLDTDEWRASLRLSMRFDGRLRAGTRIDHSEGAVSTYVSLRRPPAPRGGWGWDVAAGDDAGESFSAGALHRGPRSEFRLGIDRADRRDTWSLHGRGAVGWLDGTSFATRYVTDSFAVVDTGATPNVEVYHANQYVGTTDATGRQVVPSLRSYRRNEISINPRGLPPDVAIGDTRRHVTPERDSGALLRFELVRRRPLLVQLRSTGDLPLPAGSRVVALEQDVSSVLGWNGEVFFEDLPEGRHTLEVQVRGGKGCMARVRQVSTRNRIHRVASAPCRPVAASPGVVDVEESANRPRRARSEP